MFWILREILESISDIGRILITIETSKNQKYQNRKANMISVIVREEGRGQMYSTVTITVRKYYKYPTTYQKQFHKYI